MRMTDARVVELQVEVKKQKQFGQPEPVGEKVESLDLPRIKNLTNLLELPITKCSGTSFRD